MKRLMVNWSSRNTVPLYAYGWDGNQTFPLAYSGLYHLAVHLYNQGFMMPLSCWAKMATRNPLRN